MAYLGSEYGGWTIPRDLITADSVCYSAGVGLDVTFDLALIEACACDVFAFDPTPAAARHIKGVGDEPHLIFMPVGIWPRDEIVQFFEPEFGDQNFSAIDLHGTERYIEVPCRSLNSLMQELGHTRIDLLKLDIEGAEYAVIDSLCDEKLPISVLCVEFHKDPGIAHMKAAVRKLQDAGFTTVEQVGFDVTFVHRQAAPRRRPPANDFAGPAT